MKIYVRDDDFLIPSSAFADPLARFKEVHDLICQDSKFLHVPAVLCGEIDKFPGALEFLQTETKEGRMFPEVHGWNHVDYGTMTYDEAVQNLTRCMEWFDTNLCLVPKLFYTPWAGESELLTSAAESVGLKAVGGKRNFIEPHKYLNELYPLVDGVTIAMHWWKNGDVKHFKRILEGEIS